MSVPFNLFGSDENKPSSGDGDNMSTAPEYKSPIDELFKGLEDDESSFAKQKEAILKYVEEKKPTKETTEGTPTEGGKKKRKSKKKTKKMKKSKKSKTAKKKKH